MEDLVRMDALLREEAIVLSPPNPELPSVEEEVSVAEEMSPVSEEAQPSVHADVDLDGVSLEASLTRQLPPPQPLIIPERLVRPPQAPSQPPPPWRQVQPQPSLPVLASEGEYPAAASSVYPPPPSSPPPPPPKRFKTGDGGGCSSGSGKGDGGGCSSGSGSSSPWSKGGSEWWEGKDEGYSRTGIWRNPTRKKGGTRPRWQRARNLAMQMDAQSQQNRGGHLQQFHAKYPFPYSADEDAQLVFEEHYLQ